jgi:hypothetical protein
MTAHHLILGSLEDFITGETLADTLDERARQKIARVLIEDKGYSKEDIEVRRDIRLVVDGKIGISRVDFLLKIDNRVVAVIIFGPGSLVSRERSTIAAARLVEEYEAPVAIITNGEDAEIMETKSGRVMNRGVDAIPSKDDARKITGSTRFNKLSEERLDKERRILYVFDVLTRQECDDFTCSMRMPQGTEKK